jgi:VWFA-related protein
MRRVVLIALIAVLSALVEPLTARQEPPLSQSAQPLTTAATAVVVDTVVRDNKGNPVTDLRKEEFVLFEDGVRQEVGDFSVVAGASRSSVPGTEGATASARDPSVSFTAIVFNRLSPDARGRAYQGALAALETLQDGDFVGVFVTDRSLSTIQTYTNDRERVRKALDAAARRAAWSSVQTENLLAEPGPTQPGGAPPSQPGSQEAAATAVQMTTQSTWATLDALQQGYSTTDALLAIAVGLAIVPGRKSVVFFSEGIPVPDAVLHHFRNVIGAANRANVSVYTLDAAGLRTGSEQAQTARRLTSFGSAGVGDALRGPTTTLEMLARETGGLFVENTNDLTGAFRKVDADRRFYYLLTYTPKNGNFDGKWRTIAVKVPGRRVDIRARTGYLATRGPGLLPFLTLLEYEAPALAALGRSPAPTDLPMRAAALAFPDGDQGRVAVLAATDAAALRFVADAATGKYRTDFSILARIVNARGEVVRKASQPYRLSGPADQIDAAKRGEVLFFRQPSLEPGTYSLEVAVHDALATRSSVHRSTFVVPETKSASLQVSSLVLVRRAPNA